VFAYDTTCIDEGVSPLTGFLLYEDVTDPDTDERMFVERMMWVYPTYRGKDVAAELLREWEFCAASAGVTKLVAGASLPNPESARTAYEKAGFTSQFSFHKRLEQENV
jgi:GNAT superfamily N-acetyltransferase